ncbi:MAG: GNAT family N-acetyltransferase [Candidatus Helarchaeota archaeon]
MSVELPNIKIKAAKIDDLQDLSELMRILCQTFGSPFYEKPWLMDMKYRLETNPASVIIAIEVENKKIIGMLIADSGRDWYSGAILGQIINFIIHPDYRGLKIGTLMVERALDYLKSKNCRYVRTNCRSELPNVVKLFNKFGFKEVYSVLEREL